MEAPPGLPVERTTLAWVRTTLDFSVVSLLLLHYRGDPRVVVALIALAGVALSWSLGLAQWLRNPARVALYAADAAVPARLSAVVVTTFVVVLAVTAFVVMMTTG